MTEARCALYAGEPRLSPRISIRSAALAATDGPVIAHLRVADRRGCLRKDGQLLAQVLGPLDGAVVGERADDQRAAFLADAGDARHLAQIDDVGGRREAELHERDEALAARDHLRVASVLREEREGFGDGARSVILEWRRIHGGLLPSVPKSGWLPRCGQA